MIVLSDVSRYHLDNRDASIVLRGINLVVSRTSRIGIFGAAGAGRSTLARVACKIERPNVGQVINEGVVSWPIGFSGYLHKEMTGTENVRTVAGLIGVNADRILAFVEAFTGLGSKMSRPVGTYSAASRDRLAIACVLAVPADVYVVDGIPALGTSGFQNRCIQELQKRLSNSGLLFLSKNRKHLEMTCDTFFAMSNGTLLPASSPEHAEALATSTSPEVMN